MEGTEIGADGKVRPLKRKFPRDDIPVVKWGFSVVAVLTLLWCVVFLFPAFRSIRLVAAVICWALFPLGLFFVSFLLMWIRAETLR